MRRRSVLALALATSGILVGCDKCSGTKTENAATPSETTTQTASTEGSANLDATTETQPVEQATLPSDGTAPATPPADQATGTSMTTDTAAAPQAAPTPAPAETVTGTLKVVDVKKGTGAEAVEGKKVTVHYTGTLENGTKFDSSRDRGSPFPFVLGSGMVIAGWEQGVKGMKVGGLRKLVIPPNLAYGNRSVGGVIPPNSTLLFEIELLKVE